MNFSSFKQLKMLCRQNFSILTFHNPSLGHVMSHTKFRPDWFSRFDVYWKQTAKHYNRNSNTQISQEIHLYLYMYKNVISVYLSVCLSDQASVYINKVDKQILGSQASVYINIVEKQILGSQASLYINMEDKQILGSQASVYI